MIIYDAHVMCITVSPFEANPPLLVDPDTESSRQVASKRFKSVPGRRPQIIQVIRFVEVDELSSSSLLHRRRKLPRLVTVEDGFRLRA